MKEKTMNVYVACATTPGPSWPNGGATKRTDFFFVFLVHSCAPDRHQPMSRHELSPASVGGECRSSNRFVIMPRVPTQPRQDDLSQAVPPKAKLVRRVPVFGPTAAALQTEGREHIAGCRLACAYAPHHWRMACGGQSRAAAPGRQHTRRAKYSRKTRIELQNEVPEGSALEGLAGCSKLTKCPVGNTLSKGAIQSTV